MPPLLKAVSISKYFGTLPALLDVSFHIRAGEVIGLAGQSGSGKSVLTDVLAGLSPPSTGSLQIEGRTIDWPFRARNHGIEIITQKPVLIEHWDVKQNIVLGAEDGIPFLHRWFGVLTTNRLEAQAARTLEQLGLDFVSLQARAASLSSEERQMVNIARALVRPAKLVIVDDPAPLLSYGKQQRLLSLIHNWQQNGTAVIFASNNLDHLFDVADHIIVLFRGRLVARLATSEASREQVVAALAGTTDQLQVTPIMWALNSYFRTREQSDQLSHHKAMLEEDLLEQNRVNRRLVESLAVQVNTLDVLNQELQAAHARLFSEREEERKFLARELHDQMIQDLLAVNYDLSDIKAQSGTPETTRSEISRVQDNIRNIVGELRQVCRNLRPPTIDALGLESALQSMTHDWERRTGIALSLEVGPLERLPEQIELSIFRIVQEGLNNVRKHSQATSVSVSVRHVSARKTMVSIADNGRGLEKGFHLDKLLRDGHFGLLGIEERVSIYGGRLSLRNAQNGGLVIQAEIPHPRIALPAQ
jgi:signal transduction histidine kinase